MADSPGLKPEVINVWVNRALAKAKSSPGQSNLWNVVRQLGQGGLTLVYVGQPNTGAASNPFDPTSLPGELTNSQSVMAVQTEKGPLLVAFTANNVKTLLPPGAPDTITEQQVSALEVATIAGNAPYAGLVLDPGSENSLAIPSEFLKAGLPVGKTNARAKAILAILNKENNEDPALREAMVAAVAEGPLYAAVNKAALDGTGKPEFPVVPLPAAPGAPAGTDGGVAVIFGTSPAEIAATFDVNQWVPAPVRMNDVIAGVRKSANLKMAVIDPNGPTLQVPVLNEAPDIDLSGLLNEPTPVPGESTEPDGGTREGED